MRRDGGAVGADDFSHGSGGVGVCIGVYGSLAWRQLRWAVWTPSPFSGFHVIHAPYRPPGRGWHEVPTGFNVIGFHYASGERMGGLFVSSFGIPFWFIVALFAIPAVIRFRKVLRLREPREQQGSLRCLRLRSPRQHRTLPRVRGADRPTGGMICRIGFSRAGGKMQACRSPRANSTTTTRRIDRRKRRRRGLNRSRSSARYI